MDEELSGSEKLLLVITADQISQADLDKARKNEKKKKRCPDCNRLFMDIWGLKLHLASGLCKLQTNTKENKK